MLFLDGEISILDYNTIKLLRQIVQDYGQEYTDFYGRVGLRYKDNRIRIDKIERDLTLYAYFHDEWVKIWDNYNNQMIHKDFIDYIKKVPEKEEEKIFSSSKYAMLDKDCKDLKGNALKLHQIRKAIDNLDCFEDEYIKVETKKIRVNGVLNTAIVSHRVVTKEDNNVVFNETCDKDRVLINTYKHGSWENYVISAGNVQNMIADTYEVMVSNTLDECAQKVKKASF